MCSLTSLIFIVLKAFPCWYSTTYQYDVSFPAAENVSLISNQCTSLQLPLWVFWLNGIRRISFYSLGFSIWRKYFPVTFMNKSFLDSISSNKYFYLTGIQETQFNVFFINTVCQYFCLHVHINSLLYIPQGHWPYTGYFIFIML